MLVRAGSLWSHIPRSGVTWLRSLREVRRGASWIGRTRVLRKGVATAMSVTEELLLNNAAYAESFEKGDLPLPPARGVAVVACMDARLDVHKILGLQEGDAHVIRNAGGVITDDEIKAQIHEDVGLKPHFSMESFSDLEEDVRQSMARIQASPFISHKESVRGFVYEVESGRLREVN